ncbi:MAG TPA: hypothetical protein VGP19_07750 [Candidatus Acidoferrales bacterium]|jgi:hypothetical protein|nr:hypothetical protein [Candidatus Acidoferrales bacterium]
MTTFTFVQIVLSLIGILSGFVIGLFVSKRLEGWTAVYLASAARTSVTDFLFPFDGLLASHVLGIRSLLAPAHGDAPT